MVLLSRLKKLGKRLSVRRNNSKTYNTNKIEEYFDPTQHYNSDALKYYVVRSKGIQL